MTTVSGSDEPLDLAPDETVRLLGGKAAQLRVMTVELGLPVPPSFTITTDVCRDYLARGWPAGLDAELREHMARLEARVGRGFGDPADPLLVSVRSGAPVSMPGMMDTILDLGLNDVTTVGLARVGGERFAAACRERLATMFGDVVGVADVPDDPWAQLRLAIEAVFRSWNSERARAYRARDGIPDDLGTAVTVQAMVFGNRGPTSGTGVLFTRNPATGEAEPYGDVLFDAQGEDVVAGTQATEPISVLDERLPAVAAELRVAADRLERHYADLCDIEFTIEAGRLWLLQVRVGKRSPQAALRIALEMAEDEAFPLTRGEAVERVVSLLAEPPTVTSFRDAAAEPIAVGLPASPGLANGPIVTSPEAAMAAAETGRRAILVRAETSPDDVHGMAVSAGILTSRGGLVSHAAVVARGWGIPAVVGAATIEVRDGEVVVGSRTLRPGDVVTIDGSTGQVFEGTVGGATTVVPEAAVLREWAREIGIAIEAGARASSAAPETGSTAGEIEAATGEPAGPAALTAEDLLRVVSVKGFATAKQAAEALLAPSDTALPILEGLASDGLVATTAGAYRLTEAGTARAGELLAEDRAAWGAGAAEVALDAFLDLDRRMKAIVTAWQVRDDRDGQVLNDHADEAYDRGVLERLAGLHADAAGWLVELGAGLPRLATYRSRLARAAEAASGGDGRFVASPRVDSYHGAWFELHEDLIRLAGRTREDEAAAGRA